MTIWRVLPSQPSDQANVYRDSVRRLAFSNDCMSKSLPVRRCSMPRIFGFWWQAMPAAGFIQHFFRSFSWRNWKQSFPTSKKWSQHYLPDVLLRICSIFRAFSSGRLLSDVHLGQTTWPAGQMALWVGIFDDFRVTDRIQSSTYFNILQRQLSWTSRCKSRLHCESSMQINSLAWHTSQVCQVLIQSGFVWKHGTGSGTAKTSWLVD